MKWWMRARLCMRGALTVAGFVFVAGVASPQLHSADSSKFVAVLATPTAVSYLPCIMNQMPPTGTRTPPPPAVKESFESQQGQWTVFSDASGSGTVQRSTSQASDGVASAQLSTASGGSVAAIRVNFLDDATTHRWKERPGTRFWQMAKIYLPSATVAQLGANDYLTLGALWSSGANYGWYLRVRQGGALYVQGTRPDTGALVEFPVYGTFPQDQWVTLELGLKSQAGPGVGRAFAFLINGSFYGWYHQGLMQGETYDHAAMGIVSTNSAQSLTVYVDQWYVATAGLFPGGPDHRSVLGLQEQDFRTQNGEQWQIDWSTWALDLRLNSQFGLYSANDRLQSGRNLDRMPDLSSGWAEIEIDWPNGTPPDNASMLPGAFAGLVGMHKELNREENLEVAPVIKNGSVTLLYDAWVGSAVEFATWTLPAATTVSGRQIRNIPEPGDIIRVRWQVVSPTTLNVRASYFDASANHWYNDVINDTRNLTNVGPVQDTGQTVNYLDGYHTASSITIDTPYYSIRRYEVGVLSTYPGP
jgi:hypothetical protein